MEALDIDENSPAAAVSTATKSKSLVILSAAILQIPVWGAATTFGVLQEEYSKSDFLHGSKQGTGVIGTTLNGVMYLSMPILFTLLDRGPLSHRRQSVGITGVILSSASFAISSFSSKLWHLVLLQGILAALGNALIYCPSTLYVDEWFSSGRATAYGAVLSSKSLVGTILPLLLSYSISYIGLRWTLRIWAVIVLVVGLLGVSLIPTANSSSRGRLRRTPWGFLRHKTIYLYTVANIIFSCAYAMPQTYLTEYAREVLQLSSLTSSLMITAFNAPSIVSAVSFGILSDKYGISAKTNTLLSAVGSSLCAFLLWGTASNKIPAVLIAFSCLFGFFAGGYSGTWGGWIKDLEREAVESNEAINTGMVYGILNGARGVGYVASGFVGVELFNAGPVIRSAACGFGTEYGAIILVTGLGSMLGGICWKSRGT